MVDPDNEERLLKVPPSVVYDIKAEAYSAAREAIAALVTERELRSPSGLEVDVHAALAAIDALKEKQ